MTNKQTLVKVRYYSSVAVLNGTALLLFLYVLNPFYFNNYFSRPQAAPGFQAVVAAQAATPPEQPVVEKKITSGKPVRIVIPSLALDVPIDDGTYNPANGSWTLSDYRAQYATPTPPVNDAGGNTLIYGHNNRRVFGRLKELLPSQTVQVYTDNNHIFTYRYETSEKVRPDNVALFQYQGPPLLTIQTCSGNWNELRQLSYFKLVSVE